MTRTDRACASKVRAKFDVAAGRNDAMSWRGLALARPKKEVAPRARAFPRRPRAFASAAPHPAPGPWTASAPLNGTDGGACAQRVAVIVTSSLRGPCAYVYALSPDVMQRAMPPMSMGE